MKFRKWFQFHVGIITGSWVMIRDWPESRKSKIPPPEFCPLFGDWDELWIPTLTLMSLKKCDWMIQNGSGTTFTGS